MAAKHVVMALAALASTAWVAAAVKATTMASLPEPRSDHSCDLYKNYVYITGGCKSDQVYYDEFGGSACAVYSKRLDRYDLDTNTWASLADMPKERFRHTSAVAANKLFVFGGIVAGEGEVASTDVDVYDITTNTWRTVIGLFPNATVDLDSGVVRNSQDKEVIVLVGGYTAPDYTSVNATHLFDPVTETFTFNVATLNHDRGDLCVSVVDNKVYASGGYDDATFCAPVDAFEVFDIATNTWTDLEPNPEAGVDPAGDLTCAVYDKKVYNLGGEQKNAACNASLPVAHVDAYNTVDGKWIDAPFALTSPRFRFCAATANNAIYVFGGQGPLENLEAGEGHRLLNRVERYDMLDSSPAARASFSAVLALLAAALAVVVVA